MCSKVKKEAEEARKSHQQFCHFPQAGMRGQPWQEDGEAPQGHVQGFADPGGSFQLRTFCEPGAMASPGRGWGWRGCAGQGSLGCRGALLGSPVAAGTSPRHHIPLGCRDTCELQQLLGKASSFWQRENHGEQAHWLNFSWVWIL